MTRPSASRSRDTLPAGFTFISADDTQRSGRSERVPCASGRRQRRQLHRRHAQRHVNGAGTSPTPDDRDAGRSRRRIPGTYTNTRHRRPEQRDPRGQRDQQHRQASTTVERRPRPVHRPEGRQEDSVRRRRRTPGGDDHLQAHGHERRHRSGLQREGPRRPARLHIDLRLSRRHDADPDRRTSPAPTRREILCTAARWTARLPGAAASRTIGRSRSRSRRRTSRSFAADQAEHLASTITNQAFVDPDNTIAEGERDEQRSTRQDTIVSSAIDLTLDKQGPGSATQNQTTTYTITVKNRQGRATGATAFDVKIVDPLPVGLIPLERRGRAGQLRLPDRRRTRSTRRRASATSRPDDDVTITITAFVTQNGGTLDNEACVDPDDTIAETNELDNCKHAIGRSRRRHPTSRSTRRRTRAPSTAGQELELHADASRTSANGPTRPVRSSSPTTSRPT